MKIQKLSKWFFRLFITNSIKDKKNLMHQNICNGMSSRLIKMNVMISQVCRFFLIFQWCSLYYSILLCYSYEFCKLTSILLSFYQLLLGYLYSKIIEWICFTAILLGNLVWSSIINYGTKRCVINETEMNERFHFLIRKIIVALFVFRQLL